MRVPRLMGSRPRVQSWLRIRPNEGHGLAKRICRRVIHPRNIHGPQRRSVYELIVSPLEEVLRIIHSSIVPNIVPRHIRLVVQHPSLRSKIPIVEYIRGQVFKTLSCWGRHRAIQGNWRDDILANRAQICTIVVEVMECMPLLYPSEAFLSRQSSSSRVISENSQVMHDPHETVLKHIGVVVIPKMRPYYCSEPVVIEESIVEGKLIWPWRVLVLMLGESRDLKVWIQIPLSEIDRHVVPPRFHV
jgi:hypothetical protein